MTFPTVEDITETAAPGDASPATFNLPATVNAGDLLIAFVAMDSAGDDLTTPTEHGGWTALDATSATATGAVWALDAAGTEDGSTITTTYPNATEDLACQIWRISGWGGTLATDVDISTAVSTAESSSHDPGSVAAGWGSDDNLYIVALMTDDDETINTYPYADNNTRTISGTGSGTTTVATCSDNLTASSADPGAWSIGSSEDGVTWTLVVKPAAAGGTTPHGPLGLALHGPFGGPLG